MLKYAAVSLFFWLTTVSEVLAGGGRGGGDHSFGGGKGGGGTLPAPEIDGPAGVAAIALLVSAGFIAYSRYKKK